VSKESEMFSKLLSDDENLNRVRKNWVDHLDSCRQCNYDVDCFACKLKDIKLLMHSCNCKVEPGFGYLLGQEYRAILKATLLRISAKINEERTR
jgi:hypothetical protein